MTSLSSILRSLSLVGAILVMIIGAGAASAQDYPTKPIRMIVPNAPGNAQDVLSRVLAAEMSKSLGQSVFIEYKPGASQLIGYEYVAKQAPADGYTVISTQTETLASMPVTVKDLRFDPVRDLPPIIGIGEGRFILVTSSKAPWKTIGELVAHAKANPGKLNYAYNVRSGWFMMELFVRGLGIKMVDIPLGGNVAATIQGLYEGTTHMTVMSELTLRSAGDKLVPLAVTGETRHAAFREVPTFAELGFPRIRGFAFSLNAPAGTPKIAVDKLQGAVARVLRQPEMKAALAKFGMEASKDATTEVASKTFLEVAKVFAEIAKQTGFRPE